MEQYVNSLQQINCATNNYKLPTQQEPTIFFLAFWQLQLYIFSYPFLFR